MERWKEELIPLLPQSVQKVLHVIPDQDRVLEIRLREGKPMQLVLEDRDRLVYAPGGLPMMTQEECANLLSVFCDRSVYAWEQELSNGFITLSGGYRVGIAGRAVTDAERVTRFTSVNGFCIRIVREQIGAAIPTLSYVLERGKLLSTLLISPPNCGKTTVLRDLIRIVSDGLNGCTPQRVCVADERFELSGFSNGRFAFDLGTRTDVVSGIPKAEALERMLAAMSPQVIATDELNTDADAAAILRARGCGVTVLTTAHTGSFRELLMRKALSPLLSDRVFSRIVLLSDRPVGAVQTVYDADGTILYQREEPK